MRLLLALFLCTPVLSAQTVQIVETRADQTVLLQHSAASFGNATGGGRKGVSVRLLPEKTLQRMDGFGASLTGSSAALLMQLSPEARNAAMHEVFDPAGPLGLTLLRQPIGASDFSPHGNYSYDDTAGDTNLSHFSLAPEAGIFPLLRQAFVINPSVRILALPWSAPAWMKSSKTMNGGSLDSKFLAPYAGYLNRAVSEYAREGLPIYALSLQNEPENENASYPTQAMSAKQEIELAAHLRPRLRADGRTTLLFGYEHNWNDLDYPEELLGSHLFDGISFHCYRGEESAQRTFLLAHPGTNLWFTECSGTNRTQFAGDLLWQSRHLLLGAPLNGARSVLLWNLILDPHGNPHNGGCSDCRALLTLEKDGHVTRNVEFYVLAHAAPFVHPDARLIETSGDANPSVLVTAYRNLDGTLVALALNSGSAEVPLKMELGDKVLEHTLPGRSITTFAWGNPLPTVAEGLYRIALTKTSEVCLAANLKAVKAKAVACSSAPEQLWVLTHLTGGRVELRNLSTTQDLTQGLALAKVDGDHVSPTTLTGEATGFCLGAAPCAEKLRFIPTETSR